jgi:hypothetical protein
MVLGRRVETQTMPWVPVGAQVVADLTALVPGAVVLMVERELL